MVLCKECCLSSHDGELMQLDLHLAFNVSRHFTQPCFQVFVRGVLLAQDRHADICHIDALMEGSSGCGQSKI